MYRVMMMRAGLRLEEVAKWHVSEYQILGQVLTW